MLSKADELKVCKLYQAGESVTRIALDLEVSRRTLERRGVERRPSKTA